LILDRQIFSLLMETLPPPYEPVIRILIAEDDESLCEVLEEHLKVPGRAIRTCSDGAQAVAALKENPFDMVIADLVMPELGGLDVLRAARDLYPDVIVIIMTGYASLDSAIEAIRGGAYDYIRKPFKLDELDIAVKNGCEKIALVRENRLLVQRLKDTLEELSHLRDGERGEWAPVIEAEEWLLAEEIPDIEMMLKQVPPDHDLKRKEARDNALNSLERLIRLRKEGFIDQEEFRSLKARLLHELGET
jgi:DNA-binding response OmpR family regulator